MRSYNELHLASVLDKKKIATGKSKHGLAAKFLTKDGKAVNYEIFEEFMVAGYADLRPAATVVPPWQLPATAKPRSPTHSGDIVEWPSQSVPTSLHDDAMHAAPMRLDYALANSAAQRRMGSSPENWHAGPVQTLFTDTLSDHFPLQVLLCESGINGQSSRDCAVKIQARLEAREGMEARLDCDSDGWNDWKLRHVMNEQNAAREAVSNRLAKAVRARPPSIIEAKATAAAHTRGAESAIKVKDRRIEDLIDWTDPLLWRPAPRSPSSEARLTSTGGDLELGQSWEVVRVRGRAGASCTQTCLDEGRRRRRADELQQHIPQGQSSGNNFQAQPVATAVSATMEADGLGASRQVPGGFELKQGAGGLRRDRRRLAQHYEHSASLFGHAFDATKLKELEQREQAKNGADGLPPSSPTATATPPTTDFAAEAAVAGAINPAQEGQSEQEDCFVHETHGFCANGGVCIHLFGGAGCACEEGFSGHHCDNVASPDQQHGPEDHASSEAVAPGDQRLADAIARVKTKNGDLDLVLKSEILSGTRGPQAKALLMEVTDTSAGAMTPQRMTTLLHKGAEVGVDLDVLLLARTLAMQQLPPAVQQAIDSAPVQHLHPQAGSGAGTTQRQRPPVTELDWRCSAKQTVLSNDCEQMTAEFGCANGCR